MTELYKVLHIKSIKEEIKNFKTFCFDEPVNYEAGQYLTFVVVENGNEVRRSYSITSSPYLNEPISIGVKRIENGFFSRKLIDTANKNDELITIGAGGLFVLPDDIETYKQFFFFAAGSGITPIYSLIKTVLHQYKNINVVLVYSNSSVDQTIFLHDLKKLEQQFQNNFHAEFFFSNYIHLSKARLHRNLIEELLKKYSIALFQQTLFYICGPEPYMRLCTYTLQENNVPKQNIKREDFIINSVRKRDALPPDKNSHLVSIQLNEQKFQFINHYPNSILQTAKKLNIGLPYSCEAGRCGSCVAKCIKGKVWHSYNEVLTEKDLAKNLILTCVGHPIESDVELEIKM